jgi:hypothetical protein
MMMMMMSTVAIIIELHCENVREYWFMLYLGSNYGE